MINSIFASSAFFRNQAAAVPKILMDCPADTTKCGDELCCAAGQRCHWKMGPTDIIRWCA